MSTAISVAMLVSFIPYAHVLTSLLFGALTAFGAVNAPPITVARERKTGAKPVLYASAPTMAPRSGKPSSAAACGGGPSVATARRYAGARRAVTVGERVIFRT